MNFWKIRGRIFQFAAHFAVFSLLFRLGFGEDCREGRVVDGEAGAGDGEGCGELRMVFAEILSRKEEIVVAGGVEPVAAGLPNAALHQRVDEPQLGERARRLV